LEAEIGMRRVVLAMIAMQLGLAHPVHAQSPAQSSRPISEALPLFAKNHCEMFKDAAEQIFCGDPELAAESAKLSAAIQDRLSRLANRRLAIEENAEWIRNRNSSCGIFQTVSSQDLVSVQACLLKETQERIEILADPNFDCLATNTTAGMLICSDPALALAKAELNHDALELIAGLKEEDAKEAYAAYERWSRERDRKCGLADKDNVPLDELSSSASCLADYISQKKAELATAKANPKTAFGRPLASSLPDADAVDLCVAQIHSANACESFLGVSRVFQVDNEVADQDALVTAEIEMVVLSPFALCSPIASSCTGACWDPKSNGMHSLSFSSGPTRESFPVAHRLSVEKAFAFQKTDSGHWRCTTKSIQPVDFGVAVTGR
jgi:uncharacterized protein YecT (DUF1311 family)